MQRLLLFGKLPRLGRVKTRLVPPLSQAQALELYRAFLRDQLEFVRRFEGVASAWYADGGLAASDAGLPIGRVELRRQGLGDLGRRLARAFRESLEAGARATVVIGADSPTLPASHVEDAFSLMRSGAEVVLSPADDGGFVLLGLDRPRPELLLGVPWGGSGVACFVRRRAVEAAVRLVEIAPWYDVDDRIGLRRLREEMADGAARKRAPETARALLDLPLGPVV